MVPTLDGRENVLDLENNTIASSVHQHNIIKIVVSGDWRYYLK